MIIIKTTINKVFKIKTRIINTIIFSSKITKILNNRIHQALYSFSLLTSQLKEKNGGNILIFTELIEEL
jgi:hypothetical protein